MENIVSSTVIISNNNFTNNFHENNNKIKCNCFQKRIGGTYAILCILY